MKLSENMGRSISEHDVRVLLEGSRCPRCDSKQSGIDYIKTGWTLVVYPARQTMFPLNDGTCGVYYVDHPERIHCPLCNWQTKR